MGHCIHGRAPHRDLRGCASLQPSRGDRRLRERDRRLGFGWPKKVVALDDIVSVREVRNSWWQGWGIRRITNGWMYNVWGLDAVEVEVGGGTGFRIGTDDSERLAAALLLT